MMNEKEIEQKINFVAITSLGALKGIFADDKLDDRLVTLSLYYFLNVFCKNGWKGHKPSEVLQNAIEVIKASDDSALEMEV